MATTIDELRAGVVTGRVVLEPVPHRRPGPAVVGSRRRARRPVPVACDRSAAPTLHGGGLTRRGRVVLALAWLVLIAAGAFAFVRPALSADGVAEGGDTVTVHVEVGDTLWELAGEVAPSADRREVVAAIMELNDLSSPADLRPGDALLVPIGDGSGRAGE